MMQWTSIYPRISQLWHSSDFGLDDSLLCGAGLWIAGYSAAALALVLTG